MSRIGDRLDSYLPLDVIETEDWLLANGFVLAEADTSHGTFGSSFTFRGPGRIVITVDRGQWELYVSGSRRGESIQFDLLVAASSGQSYTARFPAAGLGGLPKQLPRGASWRELLPGVLEWLRSADDAAERIERARAERAAMMRARPG